MHMQRSIQVTSSNGWFVLIIYSVWNNGGNSRDHRLSPDSLTAGAVSGMLFCIGQLASLPASILCYGQISAPSSLQSGSGHNSYPDPSPCHNVPPAPAGLTPAYLILREGDLLTGRFLHAQPPDAHLLQPAMLHGRGLPRAGSKDVSLRIGCGCSDSLKYTDSRNRVELGVCQLTKESELYSVGTMLWKAFISTQPAGSVPCYVLRHYPDAGQQPNNSLP